MKDIPLEPGQKVIKLPVRLRTDALIPLRVVQWHYWCGENRDEVWMVVDNGETVLP